MGIFKCKMCGGTLEINENQTTAVCEYCGTKQTLPKLGNEKRANLYDRANHFRRNNEFDKAMSIYEKILNEESTDAEAYWSLVLCRYGIEYVEDPATHKRVPTVNRAQFTSIFDDDNYKSALKCADKKQKSIYEEEANAINEIQKGILAISQNESPFDVFICYKETDNNGRRTMDSVLANELYHQLIQEGFKVFFSRITLEDKLGTAYEPYIFAALNSARVMVVLGTRQEYFNAVWVKNEWSRYLSLVKNSGGKKVLIPAYKDMDPYDLPEEFSHLQAQDMSKLGFMQDLIRGIRKLISKPEKKITVKETVVNNAKIVSVDPLIERAFIYLEDGDWDAADEYFEKVLDQNPKYAEAYLGKLMADLKCRKKEEIKNCKHSFENNNNYKKVIRFGDSKLREELDEYLNYILERNEQERLDNIYNNAINQMNNAKSENEYKEAAQLFESIVEYKKSVDFASECNKKAEIVAERKRKKSKRIVTIISSVVAIFVVGAILTNFVILPSYYKNKFGVDNVATRVQMPYFKVEDGVLSVNSEYDLPASITIPAIFDGKYVTSIEDRAFENCTDLVSVMAPNSITIIGIRAFRNCTNLTSVAIPDNVTRIEISAFENCSGLTNITIPNSISSISVNAFKNCTSLKNVTIPNNVTSVAMRTFENCTSLTSVTISVAVTTIGFWAFENCSNLKDVYYAGTEDDWNNIDIKEYGNSYLKNATIHYNSKGSK